MGEVTNEMIDAGARYLRETQQAGKRLTPWADTPNATKKKWRALSAGVLYAALPERGDPELPCDVRLPPALTILPGCKLSTLLEALELRGMALPGIAPAPPKGSENG